MYPTEKQLQGILESLAPGVWDNPHIFSYDDEYRIVHTLVATKPGTNRMYYYDVDNKQFEPMRIPGR